MGKMKKLAAVASAGILTTGLAACGSSETPKPTPQATTNNNKLQDLSNNELDKCKNWTTQKDGSKKCDDNQSSYNGHYFFNGMMFGTLMAMQSNSNYKSNNLVNGTSRINTTKTNETKTNNTTTTGGGGTSNTKINTSKSPSSSNTGKSGLGSGSAGRGGSTGG